MLYFHLSKLTAEIPLGAMQELRLCYRQSCARAAQQTVKLREILQALASEGISPIVMKGAALGVLVYPAAGLRPMLDLDLLVKNSELDAAANVLASLGYVTDESYQPAEWYRSQHHHLAPLISQDGSVAVEVHNQVAPPRANVSIPIAEFWRRARSAQIASTPALVLAPEDLLLSTCIHVAIGQQFEKAFRGLIDIGEILRAYGSEIDWEQLVLSAVDCEAADCVYYCLWTAQSIVDAPVPAGLLQELKTAAKKKSIRRLNFFKNACLKFLVPRAIFPASTRMRPWVVDDLIGEILCPQYGMRKIFATRLREYWQALTPRIKSHQN